MTREELKKMFSEMDAGIQSGQKGSIEEILTVANQGTVLAPETGQAFQVEHEEKQDTAEIPVTIIVSGLIVAAS